MSLEQEFSPCDFTRLPVLLAQRVESLPDDQRPRVVERLEVDPHSFAILRMPGGWREASVGTVEHGPGIHLGSFHLSALSEAPGAVN